jgi:hypothetical protein
MGKKHTTSTQTQHEVYFTIICVVLRDSSILVIAGERFEHGFAEISNTNLSGTKVLHRRAVNRSWLRSNRLVSSPQSLHEGGCRRPNTPPR